MKILITGDKGFIGSEVSKIFRNNIPEGQFYFLRRESNNNNNNSNELTLKDINSFKFDLIINCAGKNGNKESVYQNNLLFVIKLLESVKYNQNLIFIHLSSYGVFNCLTNSVININQKKLNTLNSYEHSKFLCDQYLSNKNICQLVIYPSNVLVESNFKLKITKLLIFKLFNININYVTPVELSRRIYQEYENITKRKFKIEKHKVFVSQNISTNSFIPKLISSESMHKFLLKYSPSLVKYYLFYFDTRTFKNEN
jgi:nucleoside-diphosphate-sugar epimerase